VRNRDGDGFNVHFRTEFFDFANSQGLAVYLKNGKRHAVKIDDFDTPAKVAESLRFLAKWIEENS
jgi:hypothetical protein